jgi:hypothetical protein
MFEYTPKTKDVRDAYIDDQMRGEFGRLMGETPGEFDRWLASVKADAWDRGRKETSQAFLAGLGDRNIITPLNPYRGEQA